MIALGACLTIALLAGDNSFLLRNVTLHPVSGPDAEGVSLLVIDGRIAEYGPKVAAPKGTRAIDAKGLHVYPGLINSATQAGISEISSVRETSDVNELGDFKPQLRTAIAVNPASEHIPVMRANGITAAMVLPGGGIIAGQTSLMHLDGWTWEEMAIRRDAALYLLFPRVGSGSYSEANRNHQARLKTLHEYFELARVYRRAKSANTPGFKTDLSMEAMLPVLEGKLPVLVDAERERAIREAIAWADKEKVKIILSDVRKPGKTLTDIKSRNIPVIVGPTQALPLDEDDAYDQTFSLPSELHRAGIKFAFGTYGNQFARNLPYQAGTAVAYGLPYDVALKAVTLYPAEIWGVSDRIGSIEKGKWADLMLTDGDPFEVRTQVKRLFIRGKEVDLESKHTKLYQKYLARP